jgi:hypothetical protein
MAVNNPRNRILIFRLTQEEYQRLQEASSGSRSLSEFARAKLMGALGSDPLDVQLTELNTRVARLANLLEQS